MGLVMSALIDSETQKAARELLTRRHSTVALRRALAANAVCRSNCALAQAGVHCYDVPFCPVRDALKTMPFEWPDLQPRRHC